MSIYHYVIHTLRVWSWMNVIEMEKGSKYVLRSDARALWSCIKSLCSLFIIWVRYTANTRTKNSISQDVGVVCIWHICFLPIATDFQQSAWSFCVFLCTDNITYKNTHEHLIDQRRFGEETEKSWTILMENDEALYEMCFLIRCMYLPLTLYLTQLRTTLVLEHVHTAKWIWGRSIFSISKPSCIWQDLRIFTYIYLFWRVVNFKCSERYAASCKFWNFIKSS